MDLWVRFFKLTVRLFCHRVVYTIKPWSKCSIQELGGEDFSACATINWGKRKKREKGEVAPMT